MPAGGSLRAGPLRDEPPGKAAPGPRARAHHNTHATAADPVQRFLVVACGDSYFRPHRHKTRSELAVIVRGRVDVLTFDERGRVTADRKSTRLNSSHQIISYAVFCFKKNKVKFVLTLLLMSRPRLGRRML